MGQLIYQAFTKAPKVYNNLANHNPYNQGNKQIWNRNAQKVDEHITPIARQK